MEPSTPTIVIYSRVKTIEEKFHQRYLSGVGKEAVFEAMPKGWFVLLEGSWEFLYIGETKPNINIGDKATIRITFDGTTTP